MAPLLLNSKQTRFDDTFYSAESSRQLDQNQFDGVSYEHTVSVNEEHEFEVLVNAIRNINLETTTNGNCVAIPLSPSLSSIHCVAQQNCLARKAVLPRTKKRKQRGDIGLKQTLILATPGDWGEETERWGHAEKVVDEGDFEECSVPLEWEQQTRIEAHHQALKESNSLEKKKLLEHSVLQFSPRKPSKLRKAWRVRSEIEKAEAKKRPAEALVDQAESHAEGLQDIDWGSWDTVAEPLRLAETFPLQDWT